MHWKDKGLSFSCKKLNDYISWGLKINLLDIYLGLHKKNSSLHEQDSWARIMCHNVELTQATGCSFCDAQGKYHAN